ncbi:unnamed protein product [Agarophyton chilense]
MLSRAVILAVFLILFITQTLGAPTRYTMRYGTHDTYKLSKSAAAKRRNSDAAYVSDLAKLVRRRQQHIAKLRAMRLNNLRR